jgi:hypothetical protein
VRRRSTTHPGRYAARAVALEPDEKLRIHIWFILAGVIGVLGLLGLVLR